MADLTKLSIFSEVNYLKRDDSLSGSGTISISSGSGSATMVISHGLGYIPMYTYAADLEANGIIWSTQVSRRNLQSAAGSPELQMFSYATTSQLVLGIANSDPGVTRVVPVYFTIYLDYGT